MAELTVTGQPDPAEIRGRVARGRGLIVRLAEVTSMPAAAAVAQELKAALPEMTVFATSGAGGVGVTVLQVVSDAEAAALRPALDGLVSEFRRVAGGLVDQMADGEPDSVWFGGAGWSLAPHGPHCRFENESSGEVVEADLRDPDAVDPYFLLEFARTSGRHPAVAEACVEGFHDMCRLLDRAAIRYR
jgi:hypothetical protein